ncbi:MAG: carbohydrate porin [Rhodoblastus sp.]
MRRGGCALGVLAGAAGLTPALAADTSTPARGGDGCASSISAKGYAPDASIAEALPGRLGGFFGARKALAAHGFQFGLKYIGEVLSNVSGGEHRGTAYGGRLEMSLDVDFCKTLGVDGLSAHINAYQIHGRGLSAYYVGNFMPVSNIEATRATRLFEAWIQQDLFGGKASLRVGQIAADQEFLTSELSALFIHSTFGWPTLATVNLPSGGPAYPLATPGARLEIRPHDDFLVRAAIFNGDPAGPGGPFDNPDPQARNNNGLKFRLRDRPFVIAEAQGKYTIADRPGTLKIGGWTHFGRFPDMRWGVNGLSLADPASLGVAINHRGNYGFYGVIDQQIDGWNLGDGKGIGVFARALVSPSDRNPMSFYLDGGINFNGVLPGRERDAFGIAVGYGRISGAVSGLDYDTAFFTGVHAPIRAAETVIEATYKWNVMQGWDIQPDFQYVIRPDGGVPDARDPLGVRRVGNAVVFGVRSTLQY